MSITETIADMGITMNAVFVPFSQSRHKAEKTPRINWRVTLRYNGRDVITTDYSQGCGSCPAYKNPSLLPNGVRDPYLTNQRIAEECETGRSTSDRHPLAPPDVDEVLYALMCDASVLDSGDFANWCAEFGYSDDSIAARRIYDDCLQTSLLLRAAFGDKTMCELRELMADM